ncbi:MAG: methionine synthase, partial [Propionibacterium sp.]
MRATGAGSLPGDDFRGSLDFVLAEFPEMVPLPELPQRGITSQMVSRAVALLADMPAELIADSWQLTSHISSGQRSSAAQLRSDLDDLEEIAQEFEGTIKVAICGPWTLAALLGRS